MQTKKRLKMNKRGTLALSQILILIVGIIAIGYTIGSDIKLVSSSYEDGDTYESWTRKDGKWTSSTGGDFEGVIKTDADITAYQAAAAKAGGSTIVSAGTNPGVTNTPTPSGYVAKGYESIFGEGQAAPAGSYITSTGKTITTSGLGYSVSGIISAAGWALTVYAMVKLVGGLIGLEKEQVDAAAIASAAGIFVGKGVYSLIKSGGVLNKKYIEWIGTKIQPGTFSIGVGIIVAVIIYYYTYKEVSQETVTFTCYPWDAPVGGKYCEECNKQGMLPCSEYQCRSLGQSCQLLNPGTEEENCVWVNRNDVEFPIIEPWEDALLDDYRYRPDQTISPPDRGVKIEYREAASPYCVKAFTPLSFGVILNEPAKCKIDFLRKDTFDEMDFYFGGSSLLKYNHSQVMSLPGPSALESENLTIQNDGEYELYVRCQDANGNTNTANFVFKFCVEKGPDTTPPLIVTTDLLNNMPIAYNKSSIDLEVYVNEPADCKWSHTDQSYDNMEEEMACSSSVFEMNAQMLYKCSTKLTGLKNRVENKFYFRCKDQPRAKEADRNVNTESYEFVLIGTQPLIIDSVGPNETIKDSTESVKVTLEAITSAGYKEGEATCYYSDTGETDSYIMFFETESHEHYQDLWLAEGDYEYFIKCIDLGGNSDIKKVNFRVESDSSPPIVLRAYHEETYLKLVTNEQAECVYDTADCSYLFDDGISMSVVDDINHFTDWNTKINFYVKCRDEYGNQPLPDECSIIVRPFKIYSEG